MDKALEDFLKFVENTLAQVYDAATKLHEMPAGTEEEKAAFEASKMEFGNMIGAAKADIETAAQNMGAAISASNAAAFSQAVDAFNKRAEAAFEDSVRRGVEAKLAENPAEAEKAN